MKKPALPHVERVGPLELRVFARHGEIRVSLNTDWGTGFSMSGERVPDLVEALKRIDRARRSLPPSDPITAREAA